MTTAISAAAPWKRRSLSCPKARSTAGIRAVKMSCAQSIQYAQIPRIIPVCFAPESACAAGHRKNAAVITAGTAK